MYPFATSAPSARDYRYGRAGGGLAGRCGDFPGSRGGLALIRSMGSTGGARAGRQREKGLLRTRPAEKWNQSDPGSQIPWFGEVRGGRSCPEPGGGLF